MNLVFVIAIIVFIVVVLLIRQHESKDRKLDELAGEKIIYKKHWRSMWIDDLLHKQMMTMEFRETYFCIYQTFSARTVFRIKYTDITKSDRSDMFKRFEYEFLDSETYRIIKFLNPESEVLDLMKEKQESNQSLQPTVKTPVESGDVQGTAAEL